MIPTGVTMKSNFIGTYELIINAKLEFVKHKVPKI